jgi:hypothetical protein
MRMPSLLLRILRHNAVAMTHFADLDTCTYFGPPCGPLLAIGWLDRKHAYSKEGTVTEPFMAALEKMFPSAWQPFAFAGWHDCNLCGDAAPPARGFYNLFVPTNDTAYVAPFLIKHYILVHGYVPPTEFQAGAIECAALTVGEYMRALIRHRVDRLAIPPSQRPKP